MEREKDMIRGGYMEGLVNGVRQEKFSLDFEGTLEWQLKAFFFHTFIILLNFPYCISSNLLNL